MQSKDIKVGEVYTYRQYARATPQAARVEAKGLPVKARAYGSTSHSGVKITLLNEDGTDVTRHNRVTDEMYVDTRTVASRNLGPELWKDYVVVRDREQEAARARQQARVLDANARWARIKTLDEFFIGEAVPAQTRFVYGSLDRDAAERAGFEIVDKTVVLHGVNVDGDVDHGLVDHLVREVKATREV
jgi:hypothetical protein